jgi:hypothetical protein
MRSSASRRRLVRPVLFAALAATGFSLPAPAGTALPRAQSGREVTAVRYYTMTARVRPFLVWITREDVGGARLKWSRTPGAGTRLELLVGSDPARAPRSINRWGFISESTLGGVTSLTGIMTETDDGAIDRARSGTANATNGHVFRAMQSMVRGGRATTSFSRLVFATELTYRDYGTLLQRLPSPQSSTTRLDVPPNVDPGFLTAMDALMRESAERQREASPGASPARGLRREYVYMGKMYDLTLQRAEFLPDAIVNGRSCGPSVDGEFEIRNRTTGVITGFRMVYSIAGPESGTPLRIVYRPRWWIELDLRIEDTSTSKMAMSLSGLDLPGLGPMPPR